MEPIQKKQSLCWTPKFDNPYKGIKPRTDPKRNKMRYQRTWSSPNKHMCIPWVLLMVIFTRCGITVSSKATMAETYKVYVLLAKYSHCARMTDYNDISDRWKIPDGLRSLMDFCYTIINVAKDERLERCVIFRICTIATILSSKSYWRRCYLLCTTMYKIVV